MKRLIGVLVAGVVVVAACSGDGTDPPAGPTETPTTVAAPAPTAGSPAESIVTTTGGGDGPAVLGAPCSYLSDTAMGDILGKEVTGEASGDLLCVYIPADAGSGGIELLVQDVADVGCELVFSVGGFEDEEPVDGVGTYARYSASGVTQMAVCYDERVTLVATMYAEPPDPKAALIAVGKAVEDKLS